MNKFNILRIISNIIDYFNLDKELEGNDYIYSEINKGVVFRGTNLWILVFAIMVASVGLNMNSTAVIIGAMLISPLMGPIIGMGYAIATYDFTLFRKSVKNFSFAVAVSLVTSFIYFLLSPISTAHSELLARTSPSIYDVLIALFGGLAGIVAISSKQKGNVIPGVAIATALMPPLCTAGYGLATGQLNFFLGALYLFTINTVFIALSVLLISKFLKFPYHSLVEEKQKQKIDRWITVILVIVILPSLYFGYTLVLNEKFSKNAQKSISEVNIFDNNFLINSKIDPNNKTISLIFSGQELSNSQKKSVKTIFKSNNIDSAKVTIFSSLNKASFDDEDLELVAAKDNLKLLNSAVEKKDKIIDSLTSQKKTGNEVLKEISVIYPQIKGCYYSQSMIYHDTLKSPKPYNVIVISTSGGLQTEDKIKIKKWMKRRLNINNVKIFYE